jgi:protein involved in plasmid replication-relaxation
MLHPLQTRKGAEKFLAFLAVFGYLTAEQLRKVAGYQPKSLGFVRQKLNSLAAAGFVMALPGRFVTQPRIYTLTAKGYTAASALGVQMAKRVKPSEERDKARNRYFMEHTLAVSDVLVAAWQLPQTHPGIVLSRLLTERELKRKIYVEIPERICIEPDASCEFTITEAAGNKQVRWMDFFHIEVYRTLPPADWRFKQKVRGYITAVTTGQHEELFHTPALSIAVIAQTEHMTATLKQWAEEALQEMERPEEGERFFFRSVDMSTAAPEELFLAPVWERAFGTTTTPLLVLE